MRIAFVSCLLVAAACHKKGGGPETLGDVDVSYTTSATELTVEFDLHDLDQHRYVNEGTLEVALYPPADGGPHTGQAVCTGTAAITATSYEDERGKAVVKLSGCPAMTKLDKDVRVHFTAADPSVKVRPTENGDDTFTKWTASFAAHHEEPPDPAIAAREAGDHEINQACLAKDSAKAAAIRAKVAPAIEVAAAKLPDLTHHAISAILAGPDPCARFVSVFVKVSVIGPLSFQNIENGPDDFAQAAEAASWGASDRVDALNKTLQEIGGGYLSPTSGKTDPDAENGPKLVITYRVYWKDAVALGDQGSVPRLRVGGEARFVVPPSFDEKITLDEVAFEPQGQEVRYKPGQPAGPVVDAEVRQLRGKLGTGVFTAK